jgi:hypothetical protein
MAPLAQIMGVCGSMRNPHLDGNSASAKLMLQLSATSWPASQVVEGLPILFIHPTSRKVKETL